MVEGGGRNRAKDWRDRGTRYDVPPPGSAALQRIDSHLHCSAQSADDGHTPCCTPPRAWQETPDAPMAAAEPGSALNAWVHGPVRGCGPFLAALCTAVPSTGPPSHGQGHPTTISRAHPPTPTSLLPFSSLPTSTSSSHSFLSNGSTARKLIPRFGTASSVE